ncbi:MAG: TonB family protein [Burkholderiales bacterium]
MSVSTSTAALFSSDSQRRVLLTCVGVSVALHALALFGFPGLGPGAPVSGAKILTATFTPKPASPELAPAVDQAAPRLPEPQPGPPQPKPEIEPETPRPVLAKSAPDAPAVPQQAASAPTPSPALSIPAQTAGAAPSVPEAQVPATPGETAARPAADAGTLDQYRLALIDAAGRYKRYPVQAMENGWQGRVEIRLVIGVNGMIRTAGVKTSSGYRILDDQAMDMVKKAKPLTQIPSALRGREFTVDIPVIFDLQTG